MRWIIKNDTFLMASTSSIAVQSLRKIVQRAPALGAKIRFFRLLPFAGIKFTHRPKIRFFAPQGRLVAPIQVKLCTAHGHLGPRGCAKFHINRHRWWECGPKNIFKNPHFGKEAWRLP